MQDIKARLQAWYEGIRCAEDQVSQDLAKELTKHFPELLGDAVKDAGSPHQNEIVQDLLHEASKIGFDMDRINDRDCYSAADRMEFAQLIGYSPSGRRPC